MVLLLFHAEPDKTACISVSCGPFWGKLQKEPREPDERRALSVSRRLLQWNMAEILLDTDDRVSQPFRERIYGEIREIPFSKRTTRPLGSFAQERIWESLLRSTPEVYNPPSAPQFVDNRINLNQENIISGAHLAPFPGNPLP